MLANVLTSAASWNSEQPLLTYTVPPELEAELRAGQLVAVPYGDKLVEGIVWDIQEPVAPPPPTTARATARVAPTKPRISLPGLCIVEVGLVPTLEIRPKFALMGHPVPLSPTL